MACIENNFDLLNYLPIGIFVINKDFNVLFWNSVLANWTNIDSNEVLGKNALDYIPRLNEDKFKRRLESSFIGGPPVIFAAQLHKYLVANRNISKNVFQHVTVSSIKIAEHEYAAMFAIEDVTELTNKVHEYQSINSLALEEIQNRKKAETALKQNLEFLNALIDTIPSPIYFKDIDGKYIGCNKEFAKMAGKDKTEIVGKTIFDISELHFAEMSSHTDSLILKREFEIFSQEVQIPMLANAPVDSMLYKSLFFDLDGNAAGIIGVAIDISEIKKAEKVLAESEAKLKELNATKDRFFSIIAHDIKNPVSMFQSISELLNSSYDSFDEKERRFFIHEINESAKKLFKLLENLLFWARSQTGRLDFQPLESDLSYIVHNEISLVEYLAKNKSIEIINNVQPNIRAVIDSNMIATVLRNLVTNAIKFSFKNSKIEIFCTDRDKFWEISVKDYGTGISDDKIDELFKLDAHHTSLGTNNESGTGLGLILCKEFINRHGGTINVTSKIDHGSTFSFTVPKA